MEHLLEPPTVSALSEEEGGGEYGQTEACSEIGKRHSESQALKKKFSF